MPKNARIFLAEDNNIVRREEKKLLAEHGHAVIIEATTLQEALSRIELAKEKKVNVAVLDGSLSNKEPRQADGKIIAEALRQAISDIKIVSCSFFLQNWGDENLEKEDAVELGNVITAL